MTDRGRLGQPVFILGPHRSGTTILYNSLVEVGVFCHPTPYHLASFDEYLADPEFDQSAAIERIAARFRREGIRDRFVDGISAHALSPEEYGFAIPGERLKTSNLARFEAFCRFVRSRSDAGKTLLLKNPADLGNADFMRKSYPGARFIFVHRHPGPTITSRLRELNSLFFDYSPYQTIIQPEYGRIMSGRIRKHGIRLSLRMEALVSVYLLRAMAAAVARFVDSARDFPPDVACSVTYESLCEAPTTVIGEILRFLKLDAPVPAGIDDLVRPARGERTPNIILDSSLANRWMRPYLEYCGYDGLWPTDGANPSGPHVWPSNSYRGEDGARRNTSADEAEPG